jgi:hypothetical protein
MKSKHKAQKVAEWMLKEIEADRDALRNLADRAGVGSNAIKKWVHG